MLLINILNTFSPIVLVITGILLVVLRAGVSRVYFDIVGTFQADRMIKDAEAMSTAMNGLMLDAFSGLEEAAQLLGEPFGQLIDTMLPIGESVAHATVEFSKFVSEAEDLESVTSAITEIGIEFGIAGDEALNAASKMAQLTGVLGPGMTAEGSRLGIQFGLISGMETESAMQRMINLQQQTKFMTEGLDENLTMEERAMGIRANSMKILDQLNTVENRSAATMSQVTFVMNQFAAQAHLTGESMAYMAAMSAALIETGEEQGKGGRALRMIYARLGANTSGAADALEEYGVSAKNQDGNLRPLSAILRDLDVAMQGRTASERQSLAQTVAGNRHYVRLIKLMENFERVEILALEATLALSPAQEELNRRLESNVFALDQARAKLYNYQAIIGQQFIPAVTEATERQGDFALAFAELGAGKFGGSVTSLVRFVEVMRTMAGPMISTVLSLQQLSVATATYRVIAKSMAGEQVVAEGFLAKHNQTHQQQLNKYQFNVDLLRQLHVIKQQLAVESEAEIVLNGLLIDQEGQLNAGRMMHNEAQAWFGTRRVRDIKNQIIANEELILSNKKNKAQNDIDIMSLMKKTAKLKTQIQLKKEEMLLIKGIGEKRAEKALITQRADLAEMEAQKKKLMGTNLETANLEKEIVLLREKLIAEETNLIMAQEKITFAEAYAIALERQIVLEKQAGDEAKNKALLDATKARTLAMNKLAGAAMLAGMGLMVFGKGEKSAKMSMVLSTMAMIPYIAHMMTSTGVTGLNTKAKTSMGFANMFATITTEALTAATTKYLLVAGKFILVTAAMIAASYIIVTVMEKWFGAFKDVNEELENTIGLTVDLEYVMSNFGSSVDDVGLKIADAKVNLEELKEAQEEIVAAGGDGTVYDQQIQAIEQLIINNKRLLDLSKAQVLFDKHHIDDLKKVAGLQLEIFDNEIINSKFRAEQRGNDIGDFTRDYMAALNLAEALGMSVTQIGALKLELQNLGMIGDASIQTIADGIGVIIGDTTQGGIDVFTNDVIKAKDALDSFSNSREELFYGFNANNITGDLVKKVVQTGVDTLINTTEIIMTNNFSGLTIDELAVMVLEQIEKAATESGIPVKIGS